MSIFERTAARIVTRGALALFAFGMVVEAQLPPIQPGSTPTERNFFIATPADWKMPKTAWGDPDIQGIWPLSYVGSTNLERCAPAFGPPQPNAPPCDTHKVFLSEDEFKALQERIAKRGDRFTEVAKEGEAGRAFLSGIMDTTVPQRQTSLIMDPPDGKLPALTPEGQRLSKMMKSSWGLPGEKLVFNDYTDFDSWDRCITRGLPSSMFPYRYNNGIRILQTPGYVVIQMEMIHEARIVKLNEPPPSPAIKEWLGESRGHWEGNTLVVVTTNFKPGASAVNIGTVGAPPGNRFPISEQMKMTERFTRLNNDFLIYEITTEDPVVLTRPWTARFPLKLDNKFEMLEYTCHESNRVIGDWISVSQAEKAKAAGSGQ